MATILIVDDRLLNREFLVMLLKYANYDLLEAGSGVQALKIAKTEPVDLIITDILMPRMDGYELVEQLRKDPNLKKIPVIFYTATYHAEEAKVLAKSCGVRFVLTKPCEPQIILDMVHKALGTSPLESTAKLLPPPPEFSALNSIIEPSQLPQLHDKISSNLSEIDLIKTKFKKFIGNYKELSTEHDLLINKIKELSKNLKQIRTLSNQLVTIIDFNLDLISEPDLQKLLHLFCKGARKILGAKYSVLGILDKEGKQLKHFLFFGVNAKKQPKIGLPIPFDHGVIALILKQRSILKINNNSKIPKTDLFPNHPPIKNFLGFPIATKAHLYGFIYFADKMDGTIFSHEDVQTANMLVSELSILYENFELYDALQRHVAKLQIESTERKKAQKKLSKNKLLFRQFTENIKEVFWRTNPEMTKVIYVSPSYKEIWGHSIKSCYANPRQWFESIAKEDQSFVQETFDQLIHNEVNSVSLEFKITRPDGEIRNMYTRGFQLKDNRGKILNLLGVSSDVTAYKQAEKNSTLFHQILGILNKYENINEVIPKILDLICDILHFDIGIMWMIDPLEEVLRCIDIRNHTDLEIKSLEKNSSEMFFKKGDPLPGTVWQTQKSIWIPHISHTSNFFRAKVALKAGLQSTLASPVSYRNTAYGVVEFFSSRTQIINPELLSMVEKISAQFGEFIHHKHTQDQLLHISQHDILTGLLNRSAFEENIKKRLLDAPPPFMAFLLLNINRFRLINEAMGHQYGDVLLKTIASKLRNFLVHEDAFLGRLGGDRFILALMHIDNVEQIKKEVLHINNIFKDPIIINKKDIFVTISTGISVYPEDGLDATSLLQQAEIALQQVKEDGGANFHFGFNSLDNSHVDRLSREMDLRKALIENQFCLYYQPKIDLKTGYICGLEALIRWQHPKRGLLSPTSFIQMAEESGLIVPIGEWVLHEVCRQIKNGELSINLENNPIAINLSMYQLREGDNLIDYIKTLLNNFDINPSVLELEVTESVLAKDIEFSLQFFNTFKKMGIKITLDDFGTGYSSLKYFQYFSIDRIKIDKSFVDGLPLNLHNMAIVKAIIALSHSFGIKVIAEGVENEQQLECLIKENCDEIQGYYFSRPLPASGIKKMINENRHLILS